MIVLQKKATDDKIDFVSVVLLFVIIYGFSISDVDMRYPALLTCAIFLFFSIKKIVFPVEFLKVLLFLLALSSYSLIISTFHQTADYFETFRYLRCMVSTIVIFLFVWKYDLCPQKMVKILRVLLLLNAVSVIMGIVWPEFKNIILPISQYHKFFTAYRSTGLLNGDDAAGFFIMFGLVLETVRSIYYKKNLLTKSVFIYAIASIFVSRFTVVFVTLVLFIDLFLLFYKRNYKQAVGLLILLIPISSAGAILWILTINFSDELRNSIVNTLPSLRPLLNDLSASYIDYGVHTSAMSRHTQITDLSFFDYLGGAGYRTSVRQDIGYIKSIYAIGILGIVAQFMFYFTSVKQMCTFRQRGFSEMYLFMSYFILVILMFGWEFKGPFVFSCGFFELFMCIYVSVLYSMYREKNACVF